MQSKLSHLLRGWLVYAFLAPVSVMVQIITKRHLDTFDIAYSVGGTVIVLALAMLLPLFALYSILRATIVADKRLALPYIEDYPDKNAHRFSTVWPLEEFRFTLLGFVIACLLVPFVVWGMAIGGPLFSGAALISLAAHLGLALAFALACAILSLLAHASARREWDELREDLANPMTVPYGWFLSLFMSKWGKSRMVRELIFTTLVYPLSFFLLGYILQALIPIFQLLRNYVWAVVLILLAAVALILLPPRVRALGKRRASVRTLRRAAEQNGYDLTFVRSPYRSVFSSPEGYDFILHREEKTYYGKFLALLRPSLRVYFNENGQARIRRAFWIFNASFEVFHFDTDVLYGFEANGPKIVLVSPVSYHMRVQNEKGPVIDVGTRVGRYTIYNTSGLSGAIDRGCLPED